MYLSLVFDTDAYKELIAYFFLTYRCTYCVPKKK